MTRHCRHRWAQYLSESIVLASVTTVDEVLAAEAAQPLLCATASSNVTRLLIIGYPGPHRPHPRTPPPRGSSGVMRTGCIYRQVDHDLHR
jgi:hypothetical protein